MTRREGARPSKKPRDVSKKPRDEQKPAGSRRSPRTTRGKAKQATNQTKARGQNIKDPASVPKGPQGGKGADGKPRKMSAAQQSLRDQLMVQRLAEGWSYPDIALESGLTVAGAKAAIKRRLADAPLGLQTDPVKVIEGVFQGYQLSVGGLEAIAVQAVGAENFSAAVSAKKGANEARDKQIALLQATGRLPQELGALRHLIDLRAIAVRMLDAMDQFEKDAGDANVIEDELSRAAALTEAARSARVTFNVLLGLEDDDGAPEEVDAQPVELPEAAA